MMEFDTLYMNTALELAKKASQAKEVPIGALVVNSYGDIIGTGYNEVEKYKSQRYHAEMQALDAATQKIGDWRLDETTLYVTLEPCAMCMGFAALSRVERIVYGAPSPLFGCHLDREGNSALYTRQVKNVTEGVLAHEAATILKQFFKQKREKSA